MEKQVTYKQPVDLFLYREWNKDRALNSFFSSKRVGKCIKLLDDYYQSVNGDVSPKGWEEYYLSQTNREALMNAANFIKDKYKIDLQSAAEYVFHRVIGQTWNGMVYELRCIQELQKEFPNIEFKKAPYEIDEQYCTDWEAFSNGKLLFGIQIKPESYQHMKSPYQLKAKENHQKQVEAYKERFGVAHFFIYYSHGKYVHSAIIYNKINTYLALNINVQL